jgi:hypothetical protein
MSDLEKATADFFDLYWDERRVGHPRPTWSAWRLAGVPGEAAKAGCYAIFSGRDLLYVGVAVTEGKHSATKGKKYGLLNRLERHVIRKAGRGLTSYVPAPNKPQWKEITEIKLLGFPDDHRHMAAALELYLIKRLDTMVNAQSRWRKEGDV